MLDVLASPVGHLLAFIHEVLSTVFIPSSGPAWALSIVLLTVTVRLLLFPLFVKQIKSQRRMQELAPKIKELQKLHKGDRETLNTEMMKLYKENNANPISGCLPLLLQLPVFFALFTVIRHFSVTADEDRFGLSVQQLREGAQAKVFGAPISAQFNNAASVVTDLDADLTTVRIVAALMVVGMGATTFWTQRQMIARSGTTDPQQVMVQKLLLYVLPLSFAVSGAFFPIGVLLYWLTTNVWSMGQQAYVIKRMPPVNLNPGKPGSTTAALTGKGPKDPEGDAEATPAAAAPAGDVDEAEQPAGTATAVPSTSGSRRRRGRGRAAGGHGDRRALDQRVPRRRRRPEGARRGAGQPAPGRQPQEQEPPRRPPLASDAPRRDTAGQHAVRPTPRRRTSVSESTATGPDDAAGASDQDLLVREGDIAGDYLERLLDIADVDGDIDMDVEGERAVVAIVGDGLDALVGQNGQVLEAVQELTRLAVVRETGVRSRLMLDIGGWRAARKQELTAIGTRAAKRCAESGERVRLAPMTPFERKIVHDAVAAVPGVRSESEGLEPERRVVVLPDGS